MMESIFESGGPGLLDNVTDIDLTGSSLTGEEVDRVLQALVGVGANSGTVDVSGTNMAPTQQVGLAAVAALVGLGRTVTRSHAPTLDHFAFVDNGDSPGGDVPDTQSAQVVAVDGDGLTTSYLWTVNGIDAGTYSETTAQTHELQNGMGGAIPATAPFRLGCVLSNAKGKYDPGLDGKVIIADTWAGPSSDLPASITFPSGTLLQVGDLAQAHAATFAWYKNNVLMAGQTAAAITVTASATYQCVATVTDPDGSGGSAAVAGYRVFSTACVVTVT